MAAVAIVGGILGLPCGVFAWDPSSMPTLNPALLPSLFDMSTFLLVVSLPAGLIGGVLARSMATKSLWIPVIVTFISSLFVTTFIIHSALEILSNT